MNDLNGLDWLSKQPNTQRPGNYSSFTTLKPTPPGSGRASPLPANSSYKPPSKPATPANDTFSNLVSFSANGSNKNLSLLDQQKKLADLKAQQQSTKNAKSQAPFAGVDDSIWDSLGSGRSTPALASKDGVSKAQPIQNEEDDDLFAVFNTSDAVPTTSARKTQATNSQIDDEDDPFGLAEFQANASRTTRNSAGPARKVKASINEDDDDDVLGLLGRPVSEFPPPKAESPERGPEITSGHPQDKAVAEIVDMGFPADKARQALETTQSGLDVQAAVGWLLNQAHSEAQERSRNTSANRNGASLRQSGSRPARDEPGIPPGRENSGTPSNDAAQMASEFSATFFKTAGSLWKQGQKKFQQAVQEFNSEGESTQPKWMRDASPAPRQTGKPLKREEGPIEGARPRQNPVEQRSTDDVTDEAMMLESQRPEKPPRPSQRTRPDVSTDPNKHTSRDHSPALPSRLRENYSPQPAMPQPSTTRPQAPASRAALSRQAAEEQASQAYVSSARRRKPASQPVPDRETLSEASVAAQSLQQSPRVDSVQKSQPQRPSKSTPVQVRPPAPTRTIPAVSGISLKASHVAREAGNEHYKRGDYSAAHQAYSKSLSHLPASHPITIILLTNRALTAIKTGEPKIAISDADTAINLIGPSKGESETVDLTNGDTPKPMRDYYGKALMRKAEALEHMEKWTDAAAVWREAVESGHGGATAIQGRQRAENAARPKPVVAVKQPSATRPAERSAAVLRAGAQAEKAAISKLRAQNAAAEKADDERFLLADAVDAKINNWRGGKQDNLRALLGSLELVLWPEAGWKKISMADLVLPNKVKIQYMKGIAKVHPDKIPTSATTEQRMIAGAVFSTLNEAWDKFKKENNL